MNKTTRVVLVLAGLTAGFSQIASAEEFRHEGHREGRHGGRLVWGGHHFGEREWGIWRGGQWMHMRHEGRLGWWWVAGGVWYFYPSPVYPYPDPYVPPMVAAQPPVVVQQQAPVVVAPQVAPAPAPAPAAPAAPAPSQYWYYCEDTKTYYPYVNSCASPWKQVPATAAPK
jgi:hypothetical protein